MWPRCPAEGAHCYGGRGHWWGGADCYENITLSHRRRRFPPARGVARRAGGRVAARRPHASGAASNPGPVGSEGPKGGPGVDRAAQADRTAPTPGSPPFLSEHSERTTAREQGGGARQGGKGGRPGEGEGREAQTSLYFVAVTAKQARRQKRPPKPEKRAREAVGRL